jgi:nitrogen fixation protein NifU and related proteins
VHACQWFIEKIQFPGICTLVPFQRTFGVQSGILPMFSSAVIDHFKNPRNAGDLLDVSAVAEVTNPVCGDILRLAVKIEKGRVTAARFKTRGCVTAIACSSYVAEWAEGKSIQDLRSLTHEQISQALGGLPPATMHGAQLAQDAVTAILTKLR